MVASQNLVSYLPRQLQSCVISAYLICSVLTQPCPAHTSPHTRFQKLATHLETTKQIPHSIGLCSVSDGTLCTVLPMKNSPNSLQTACNHPPSKHFVWHTKIRFNLVLNTKLEHQKTRASATWQLLGCKAAKSNDGPEDLGLLCTIKTELDFYFYFPLPHLQIKDSG